MKKLFVLGLVIFSFPALSQAAHYYRGTATNLHKLVLTTADGQTISTPLLTFLYQNPNPKPIKKIDKTIIDMTQLEVKVDTSQAGSFVKWVQAWQKNPSQTTTSQGLLEIRDDDDNSLHERIQLKDLQLTNAVSSTVDDVSLLTVTFNFKGGKLMFRKTDDDDADDKKEVGSTKIKDDDDEKKPEKDDDDK